MESFVGISYLVNWLFAERHSWQKPNSVFLRAKMKCEQGRFLLRIKINNYE